MSAELEKLEAHVSSALRILDAAAEAAREVPDGYALREAVLCAIEALMGERAAHCRAPGGGGMSRERAIVEQAVERIEHGAIDLREWVDEVHEEIEEARERCADALDTLADLASELGDASDGATPEDVARWRAVVERVCDLLREP